MRTEINREEGETRGRLRGLITPNPPTRRADDSTGCSDWGAQAFVLNSSGAGSDDYGEICTNTLGLSQNMASPEVLTIYTYDILMILLCHKIPNKKMK